MKPSILFVDDEQGILRSLYRLFREKGYVLHLADSGVRALEILATHHIDVIISDMRMPNMNGHQLLRQVRKEYPDTVRLILSGYTDEKELFSSLLDGSASMYLLKPWDNNELFDIVKKIFELRDSLKSKDVLTIINQLEDLPTLPFIYSRLTALIDQEAPMKDIIEVIESDQVIAARLLRLANSAFSAKKIGSVHKAIVYLGLGMVKNIVLASNIMGKSDQGGPMKGLQEKLWKHAALTNKLVHGFAEKLFKKKLDENWASAGLLHDIGKNILLRQYPKAYMAIFKEVQTMSEKTFETAELKTLKITHALIGGYLLNWWQMPYPIVEAALFHHQPLNQPVINTEIVYLVHVASYFSWRVLVSDDYGSLEDGVLQKLGISLAECQQFLIEENILEQFEKDWMN